MFQLWQNKSIRIVAKIVGLLVLFLMLNPVVFIQSHERGLRFTMGAISNTVLDNGVHFRLPLFQSIEKIVIRPIQEDSKIDVGESGAITKDNQTIGASLTIFYVYKKDKLVTMWKDYGTDKISNLVTTAIKESFKSAIGNHTIFDLPMNQEKVRSFTIADVRNKLAQYPIEISELRITNYDWSDEFDKQIQQTMHRAQQVKQKEQELLITEQEAQKLVKTAEAEKQATILKAEAKAAEGEGIKKFNESIRATKDIEITLRQLAIELARVEKWNGVYVANNNYGPIPVQTGNIQGN